MATRYGSNFMSGIKDSDPPEKAHGALLGGRVRAVVETVEAVAADAQNSTYYLGQIPSNAVILPITKLHWDDLDNSVNAPTLDLGLESAGITLDADALSNGHDVKAAAGSAVPVAVANIANFGKQAWEYIAGLTEDPQEMLDIVASLPDAAVDTGGTISLELYYAER